MRAQYLSSKFCLLTILAKSSFSNLFFVVYYGGHFQGFDALGIDEGSFFSMKKEQHHY
jgi:hypothetical protein